MELRRTANAGVLLKLDGVSILLDGVCREVKPYLATPEEERETLTGQWPQVVCFSHAHKDHYDPAYAAALQAQSGGVLLGPESLPGSNPSMKAVKVCGVTVTPVATRHIGAAGKTTQHASFLIEGSKTVWVMADASPMQFRQSGLNPKPDVLLVPYAYCLTAEAWALAKSWDPGCVVLLHMPDKNEDPLNLWHEVDQVIGTEPEKKLYHLDISQTINVD